MLSDAKAAIERFCPPGNGGTEGGVKTIEAMISLLERCTRFALTLAPTIKKYDYADNNKSEDEHSQQAFKAEGCP